MRKPLAGLFTLLLLFMLCACQLNSYEISKQEAGEIALKKLEGAQLQSIKLTFLDDMPVYSGVLVKDDLEYRFGMSSASRQTAQPLRCTSMLWQAISCRPEQPVNTAE